MKNNQPSNIRELAYYKNSHSMLLKLLSLVSLRMWDIVRGRESDSPAAARHSLHRPHATAGPWATSTAVKYSPPLQTSHACSL